MKIKNIVQISDVCPAQWEARTMDDRPVYIRYRFGELSVGVGEPGASIESAASFRKEIFRKKIGGNYSGVISWNEVAPYITDCIEEGIG